MISQNYKIVSESIDYKATQIAIQMHIETFNASAILKNKPVRAIYRHPHMVIVDNKLKKVVKIYLIIPNDGSDPNPNAPAVKFKTIYDING